MGSLAMIILQNLIRDLIALAGPGNTIRATCDIILIYWPHTKYSLNSSCLDSGLEVFWFLFVFRFFLLTGLPTK